MHISVLVQPPYRSDLNFQSPTDQICTLQVCKMKQLSNSQPQIIQIHEDNNHDGRVFEYSMNKKRANAKLLQGAKAKNLDVEVKSGCVNLRFSDGSYCELILPLIKAWQQKVDEIVQINENEIKIVEVEAGKEQTGSHVDTKLVVMNKGDRLVLHAYNGTQNLMVQGKNYEQFALNVLVPYITPKIENSLTSISKINTQIKETLGAKKT